MSSCAPGAVLVNSSAIVGCAVADGGENLRRHPLARSKLPVLAATDTIIRTLAGLPPNPIKGTAWSQALISALLIARTPEVCKHLPPELSSYAEFAGKEEQCRKVYPRLADVPQPLDMALVSNVKLFSRREIR